jgi:hypothetical protein
MPVQSDRDSVERWIGPQDSVVDYPNQMGQLGRGSYDHRGSLIL